VVLQMTKAQSGKAAGQWRGGEGRESSKGCPEPIRGKIGRQGGEGISGQSSRPA
jgi:hypothetical protein